METDYLGGKNKTSEIIEDGSYIDSFRSRRDYMNFGGDYYYKLSNETPNIINYTNKKHLSNYY